MFNDVLGDIPEIEENPESFTHKIDDSFGANLEFSRLHNSKNMDEQDIDLTKQLLQNLQQNLNVSNEAVLSEKVDLSLINKDVAM